MANSDRIQLCGRLAVTLDGRRREDDLPGAQGRLLFGFLCLHRDRDCSRDELLDALWPIDPPAAAGQALRTLLSKLRSALGPARIDGISALRLMLPRDTWIDVEEATRAIHRAESAVAAGDWRRAWVAAHIARNASSRRLLAGHEARWIDEGRERLQDVEMRALEALASAGLGIGGPELALAERAARAVVAAAPYRESGHALLMRALDAKGNRAEAAIAFDGLRRRLSDDLGIAPSAPLQDLHARLLRGESLSG